VFNATTSSAKKTFAAIAALLTASACATTGSRQDTGLSPTITQACVGGALAGAAAGAALDENNRGRGALIGLAAGAILGCTAGQALNQRRMQYASDAEYLDSQIAVTQETNATVRGINASTATQIADYQAAIARLETDSMLAEAEREEAVAQLASVSQTRQLTEERIEILEREIDLQTDGLAQYGGKGDGGSAAALESEVETLREQVATLMAMNETLAGQEDAVGQFNI